MCRADREYAKKSKCCTESQRWIYKILINKVSEMRFVDADSLALERRNSILCNVVMMPAVGDFDVQQVISNAITLQAIWWIIICIWIFDRAR